jgi:hypothetical protein
MDFKKLWRVNTARRTMAMRRITVLCMIVFAAMLAMLSACAGTGVTPVMW